MHLRVPIAALSLAAAIASGTHAQEGSAADAALASSGTIDVDILFNYYEQDGEHSPVTGGVGTEELDVLSPVILLRWDRAKEWDLSAQLGIDRITSASTDNIDLGEAVVSGASAVDARAYTRLTATRQFGSSEERHTLGLTVGFSREYDYGSIQAGVDWTRSFRSQNSTLSVGLGHYADTVDLYGTDGIARGTDDRATTDLRLAWTEILGRRTVGAVELYLSSQSGFLSTPFHEVILASTGTENGARVAERLPDSRLRTAVGLRLHHSFSERFVQRLYYRYYTDDWGLDAHTIELEPHFRLPTRTDHWIFPIARLHTQSATDYFGLPETFTAADPYYTADSELGDFTSTKLGAGWSVEFAPRRRGWLRRVRRFETRITSYERDDGLDAFTISLGWGLRF